MDEHVRAAGSAESGRRLGAALTIHHLVKKFGPAGQEVVAVDGIELAIASGSTVAITGSSGSGKSTLLHLIAAIESPDAGTIRVDSVEVTDLTRRAMAGYRRGIGLVFQRFHLLPTLSALDNVLAPLVPVRADFDRRERALDLLQAVGLGARAHARPSELSGGQQQRVAIARALVNKPVLMLFDEVTSALDPELVGEVLGLLAELKSEGMTMLVATHEMGFARQVADEVVFLADGGVAEIGPPEQVLADPVDPRTQRFLRRIIDAGRL